MSSTSDSVLLSSSSSGSMQSRENVGRHLEDGSVSPMAVVGRILMETITEVREDPPDEIAESSWPAKAGYDWVAADVRNQSSLFRWSMLLNSWLNCTPVITRDMDRVGRTCRPFVFFVNRCICSRLPLHFYTFTIRSPDNRQHGYPCLTGNPWRYKDMSTDELSAADREVLEVLMKFTDKLPTKGLVRVYNSIHPIIDIEGHMTQVGKKNLTLFQALGKEKAVKAKAAGNTEVPNLQELLVEVHVHSDTKRKAELPTRPGRGKDVKKVRAALLGQGLSSGAKGPEAGLIELPETTVRKDIEINMTETLINSIGSMESDHLVRTMVEFSSKALILGRQVGSLY
ncbi:hypothetical protein DEO72_LG5g1728 [Vigna unguiculata]|uniref:Uncharacterized protein n=1 Tax=Vigna unguiculata TaxID=3917 RepID=A0A4D6LXM4_VIGUN|nr:hypothetical protein DEO72_LG5g1728 [Vigna unguiculata]